MRGNNNHYKTPWNQIIRYEQDATYPYSGTPDLLIANSGNFLACCNRFGYSGGTISDNNTFVYRSTDAGKTWSLRNTVANCLWAKMFEAGGYIGLIAIRSKFNDLVLHYTDDEWATYSTLDIDGGFWGTGGGSSFVIDNGWLFKANTKLDASPPASDGTDNNMSVVFCNLNGSGGITNISNWGQSNALAWNPAWNDPAWTSTTMAEPNLIKVGSTFYIFPRMIYTDGSGNHIRTNANQVPLITGTFDSGTPSMTLAFDGSTFVDFSGPNPQFSLNYDTGSGKFFSLTNYDSVPQGSDPNQQRNELWLLKSDAITGPFTAHKRLIYAKNYSGSRGWTKDGFQYVSPKQHPSNGAVYYVSRTAFSPDAASEHDGKYMTLHWIPNISEVLS